MEYIFIASTRNKELKISIISLDKVKIEINNISLILLNSDKNNSTCFLEIT
jgi:hypothetical protein